MSALASKPHETDPKHHFRHLIAGVLGALRDAAAFAPLFIYFFLYWNLKEKRRRIFHFSALSFLSLSLFILLLEVILEVGGKTILTDFLHQTPHLETTILGLFSIAVLLVLAHHQRERQHARTEYVLAEKIWLFLESRGALNEAEFKKLVLPLVADAFSRFPVEHVCLWEPDQENLRIPEDSVFPPIKEDGYLTSLKRGQGVAGLVFEDQRPRYVPRLYLPFNSRMLRQFSLRFPHALKFEISKVRQGQLDVVRPNVSVDAVKPPGDGSPEPFSSFLAVPLKVIDHNDSLGVLCLDFKKTDPLDRAEIKMAAALGIMIAEELRRIRASQRVSAQQADAS